MLAYELLVIHKGTTKLTVGAVLAVGGLEDVVGGLEDVVGGLEDVVGGLGGVEGGEEDVVGGTELELDDEDPPSHG
jgi:hypothetical protein